MLHYTTQSAGRQNSSTGASYRVFLSTIGESLSSIAVVKGTDAVSDVRHAELQVL